MNRRLAMLVAAAPMLLAAASVPLARGSDPVDLVLKQAQDQARAAENEMRRLERAADTARNEAAKLAARRQAAAAAIAASEAEISAADVQVRIAEARVADQAARLARQQAPVSALLAGIVSLGRRPPLLGIADSRSLDEFIRVRALLDTTLPAIRRRSAALSAELEESRELEASAVMARARLADARQQLQSRQQKFAKLELQAAERAAGLEAQAVGASDVLFASSDSAERLRSQSERRQAELELAAELGSLAPAPPRPGPAGAVKPPIAYRLPAAARVIEGLGSVGDHGIRSRGLTIETSAGQEVLAPADGTIAFTGAFRRYDGVVIIDHGRGWMTLMTGIRTGRRKGDRIRLGEPLGRALGPMTVELSVNGTFVSPALIAGSSEMVSNGDKSG